MDERNRALQRPAAPGGDRSDAGAGDGSPGPRTLPEALGLREVSTLEPYALLAADATRAVLRYEGWGSEPASGSRLTLVSQDPRFHTVQFVLAVGGPAEGFGADGERCVKARWLVLTARDRRAYLVTALREILGLNARSNADHDVLGPHRRLVYEAGGQQVRLVSVGETDTPAPTPTPVESAAAKAPTQPKILIGTSPTARRITTDRMEALPSERVRRLTGVFQRYAEYTRGGATTVGRSDPRPMPVFRRASARGVYSWEGQTRSMVVGLIGLSHCVFVIQGVEPPPVGATVEVGVPADPIAQGFVTVVGRISLVTHEPHNGRAFVEVDVQSGRKSLPANYVQLVTHWGAIART